MPRFAMLAGAVEAIPRIVLRAVHRKGRHQEFTTLAQIRDSLEGGPGGQPLALPTPVQNADTLLENPLYCRIANGWFRLVRRMKGLPLADWTHRILVDVAYGVDIGGGAIRSKRWHSLDLATGVDLVETDFGFIRDRSLHRIMSHHFIEHISAAQLVGLLTRLKPKMADDCVFRIACPDAFDGQNRRTLMDHGHVEAWSYRRLQEVADVVGLDIDLLQYCSEDGQYQLRRPLFELGYIHGHTLITEFGNFKILRGLGRYNIARGEITEEHSLFVDLKPRKLPAA